MKALESDSGISTFTIVLICKCSHLRFVAQHLISTTRCYRSSSTLLCYISWSSGYRQISISERSSGWAINYVRVHSVTVCSYCASLEVHSLMCIVHCALWSPVFVGCAGAAVHKMGTGSYLLRFASTSPPSYLNSFSPWYLYTIFPLISLLKFPPLISLFYFPPSYLHSLLYFPFISLSTVFSHSSVSPPPPHISTQFSLYIKRYKKIWG